ncbi:3-oxoacyl-ACP synthase [Parapedobacter pyrenivorans]|uniref:3-oxoacyl-ACP synthase n=1 Tax=Parapedobacter pyrenivorans TaxID=1305674 RepID=UPI00333FCA08
MKCDFHPDHMLNEIKEFILVACRQYVDQRIVNARQAIASANEAAIGDSKSSAGDKFETTREMMQQEIARNQQLLMDALRMGQVLVALDARSHKGTAKLGSLVTTNHGTFFLAISIGQLIVGEANYWVVSTASPIGQQLVGREAGQEFTFNGVTYAIGHVT